MGREKSARHTPLLSLSLCFSHLDADPRLLLAALRDAVARAGEDDVEVHAWWWERGWSVRLNCPAGSPGCRVRPDFSNRGGQGWGSGGIRCGTRLIHGRGFKGEKNLSSRAAMQSDYSGAAVVVALAPTAATWARGGKRDARGRGTAPAAGPERRGRQVLRAHGRGPHEKAAQARHPHAGRVFPSVSLSFHPFSLLHSISYRKCRSTGRT